ncbi:hypothetical protein BSL78_05516 [Apostichopus japonicus]|uniref:Lipocalin/cytosolic fatty-acid binding domain-containing protein n=1 Tax=Stichopus japonicus TaxID=307972 RepID=A0A2G8LBG3_STIJA|nr:hypothetical protein BSL78_05516 [Apostichopus japonicus]
MSLRTSILLLAAIVVVSEAQRATVPNLRAECYVGRWYQMYTNEWTNLFSNLPNPTCVTADYGAINATYISVFNSNFALEDQEYESISGYAFIPDIEDPGKLKVYLEGVPVLGNYWIFKLGPIYEGFYDYSLITENVDRQLFVLARDPERFRELYEAEILEYLRLTGFTGATKAPQEVPHTPACIYSPLPDQ